MAIIVSSLFAYLGNRMASIDRRAAVFIVIQGTVIGLVATPELREGQENLPHVLNELKTHPSLLAGALSILAFLWASAVRFKPGTDFLSRVAFSKEDIHELEEQFAFYSDEAAMRDVIASMRILGQTIRYKGRLFNFGMLAFVVSVFLYAFGL
ncbi:hypothetical protein [Roseibium sp. RKSG952]|uniref:hypothetical protein n=1 Tax=Roseibium sp. RKSG952 TaxID=2529384 RepID=UPI0012BBDFD0|nr:hypothetical protein [Roseibium sp. RKSG952]MTH94676.1 hypothetical protein [Roseibium sp. RKSG952]